MTPARDARGGMLCCRGVPERCARAAAALLVHVNLLLMLFSGAGLSLAARLKWDPSAYVVLRELAPAEYRAACALLLGGALTLMLLAHAAVGAVAAGPHSQARRPILFMYASVMSLLTLAELSACAWLASRAVAFLNSEAARDLLQLLEARDHLLAALQILSKWLPLPKKIQELIDEAEADLPRNGYAAAGAAVTLLVLQPTAIVLAVVAASARRPPPAPAPAQPRRVSVSTLASTASASTFSRAEPRRSRQKYHSEASSTSEKVPLRTAYRNGRLVII
ncbi:hypothetical protein ABMA27_002374 [Loxostege sticticalis]|uniref:Uncharacterized protein n=1 Tax=Loxostege sticticalis TaxID=481309 RepID=A0ABR3HTF7_LOXSC